MTTQHFITILGKATFQKINTKLHSD